MSLLHLPFFHRQDELSNANRGNSKPSTPANQGNVSKTGAPLSLNNGSSKANTPGSSQSGSITPLSPNEVANGERAPASSTPLSTASSDLAMESVDTPEKKQETQKQELNKNLGRKSKGRGSTENSWEEQKQKIGDDSAALNSKGDHCSFYYMYTEPFRNHF